MEASSKVVYVDGHPVTVEVLSTPEDRARGFIGRAAPPGPEQGLLFLSVAPSRQAYHMTGVPWDLEALGFDQDDRLVEVLNLDANNSTPVRFTKPVLTVLEVLRGWSARHEVSLGSSLHQSVSLAEILDC